MRASCAAREGGAAAAAGAAGDGAAGGGEARASVASAVPGAALDVVRKTETMRATGATEIGFTG